MNILLVDDQSTVLEGLRHGIDFERIGFTKVFTATGAAEALKICSENSIQVVVSDVEMPEKNGLDLLTEIHEAYPDMVRLVLTSHPVFHYAQESLKQGIFDYIVQPAPFSEIENALRKAANAVKQRSSEQKILEYGNLFKLHESEFLNGVVYQLATNTSEQVDENIAILNKSGYAFSKESFVQLLWIDVIAYSQREQNAPSERQIISVLHDITQTLPEFLSFASFITPKSLHKFSIFAFSPIGEMSEISPETLKLLESRLTNSLHSPIAIYNSGVFRYNEIALVLQRAKFVISNNITREPGIHNIEESSFSSSIENTISSRYNYWDILLRSNQMTMLRKDIHFYLDQITKTVPNKYQTLCKTHQQLLELFLRHFYNNNIDVSVFMTGKNSYRRLMDYCESVEDVKKAVDFLIESSELYVHSKEKSANYVADAKDYITKHYNEDISVKAISEYVHLNPEYFTKLFKKETGMNIIDFITDCRISMARDLLQNSDLPVSMISSEVGYSSPSHFASMFRRATGTTPTLFRLENENQSPGSGD